MQGIENYEKINFCDLLFKRISVFNNLFRFCAKSDTLQKMLQFHFVSLFKNWNQRNPEQFLYSSIFKEEKEEKN